MDNKIVGILNVISATVVILLHVLINFFVMPKIILLNRELGENSSLIDALFPIFSLLVILISLFFIWIGIKLMRAKSSKQLLNIGQLGVLLLVGVFILSFLLLLPAAVFPIYSITNI